MTPPAQGAARSCILAIEPDSMRATTLARFLRGYVHSDFVLVASTDDALRSIAERLPDLVLTSTFLPPSEEAALTAHLKQLPAAAYLQVITIPHFIDFDDGEFDESSKILNFLDRRSVLVRPRCDPRAVKDQIEHYLERARVDRLNLIARQGTDARIKAPASRLAPQPGVPFTRRLTADDVYTLTNGIGPRTHKPGRVHANDRRQAPRRSSEELGSPLTVRVPSGTQAGVINISRRGMLLESTSKATPGRTFQLELLQEDKPLKVAARVIRSEVARVDATGVKYWVAAAFDRDLEIEFVAAVVLQWTQEIRRSEVKNRR